MAEKNNESKMKKEYSSLEKKHLLPTLETLEKNFGLSDIEEEKYPLVEIRKKMHEKIDYFTGILTHLIEGEATLSNIYESKVIDEKKKTELFKLYKKLMYYSRRSSMLSVSYNEKEEALFIKEFLKEWEEEIKVRLQKCFETLKNVWETDSDLDDDMHGNYLG